MIEPERLADRLQDCAVLVRTQGPVTWERVEDWVSARMPRPVEPLSDEQEARARDGVSELDEDDRREDAAAARYQAELVALTKRLDADLARITRIIGICNPARPATPANRDLQLAQVAAEGWCVSCWRVDQTTTDIAKGRYRDLCRKCGEFKAAEGRIPPLPVLVKALTYGWSKITSGDVATAMGKAS